MQKLDYIIVGGGIAGLFCAFHLHKNGKKIMLVNSDKIPSSSLVAAGTWNPVAFKRFVLSWRANEFLAEMDVQYPELEKLLNCEFFEVINSKKLITPGNELELWKTQALTKEMSSFMNSNPVESKFPIDYYLGELKKTGRVKLSILLPAFWQYLKSQSSIVNEEFEHQLLTQNDKGWNYKNLNSKNIIFCEGAHYSNNPFFNWLPLKPAKGDIITIKAPQLKINYILKKNIFILPLGNDNYEVGATYNWKDLSWNTNEEGVNQLVEKLKKIINVPFTITNKKAGIRPTSFDRRIIMGEHPQQKGLFVFNGLGTKGVLLAPLAAKEFTNYLLNGTDLNPEMDIKRCLKYLPN